MNDQARYDTAKKEVEALRGFYIHLAVFVPVMAGLVVVNTLTGSGWWVQWPLIGWGLGIIGHAVAVFSPFQLLGRDWEQRKIKERLDRH